MTPNDPLFLGGAILDTGTGQPLVPPAQPQPQPQQPEQPQQPQPQPEYDEAAREQELRDTLDYGEKVKAGEATLPEGVDYNEFMRSLADIRNKYDLLQEAKRLSDGTPEERERAAQIRAIVASPASPFVEVTGDVGFEKGLAVQPSALTAAEKAGVESTLFGKMGFKSADIDTARQQASVIAKLKPYTTLVDAIRAGQIGAVREAQRLGLITADEIVEAQSKAADANIVIIPTVNEEYEKAKVAQEKALQWLTEHNYASADGASYRVYDLLREHPSQESVDILQAALFDSETIAFAQRYVSGIQDSIKQTDYNLSKEGMRAHGWSIKGVDPLALGRAMSHLGIKPLGGSHLARWDALSVEDKGRVIAVYESDPDRSSFLRNIAATLEEPGRDIREEYNKVVNPKTIVGAIAQLPLQFGGGLLRFGDSIIDDFRNPKGDYVPASVLHFPPKQTGLVSEQFPVTLVKQTISQPFDPSITRSERLMGLANLALVLAPLAKPAWYTMKGVVGRGVPGTLSTNAVALETDVARGTIPKGMSQLTARQLLEDVEGAQLIGKIPIDRLASYASLKGKLPKDIASIEVIRNPARGTTDMVLRSADGDIIGHVSGMQRVVNDIIWHATGDTAGLLDQLKQRGYIEVETGAGRHPFMYFSPQAASDFMFRNPGQTPGLIAIRVTRDMWKKLPREVLDSPDLGIMRQKMFQLASDGKLEPGLYPLAKGYGTPTHLEYEVIAAPGTRFYAAEPKWYAPSRGGAPTTKLMTDIAYDGSRGGKPIAFRESVPVYWFGTENAAVQGLGVPSVMDFYKAKLLGDLTAMRKMEPWLLRRRPKPSPDEPISGVTSPNPFVSTFQAFELKMRPEDAMAGRVSAVIRNERGEVLLTRTQGANHFDLPGGGTMMGESVDHAVVRELYEETGLRTTFADHVDAFRSTFRAGQKPRQFQIYEVEAEGKPIFGREVADHVWWDGQSELPYPVSPFTRIALNRIAKKNYIVDNLTVEKVIADTVERARNKTFGVNTEKAILEELRKLSDDVDRSFIPYKSIVSDKMKALAAMDAAALATQPATNGVPDDLRRAAGDNEAIIARGPVSVDSIRTVTIPSSREVLARFGETERTGDVSEDRALSERMPSAGEGLPGIELPLKPTEPSELAEAGEITGIGEPTEEPPSEPPSEPPIGPPSEPILEPPPEGRIPLVTPPPVAPPPSKPTKLAKGDNEQDAIINNPPDGTIVWKQGEPYGGPMYRVFVPPYEEDNFFATREVVKGYKETGIRGPGSPLKTLQVIGGIPPRATANVDMGIARLEVRDGKVIIFYRDSDAYGGEKRVGQVEYRYQPEEQGVHTPIQRKKPERPKKDWWDDAFYNNPETPEPIYHGRVYYGRRLLPPNLGGNL